MALVAGSAVRLGACGISTQQEIEMGQQYAAEINRQLPLLNDATVNRTSTTWAARSRSRANGRYPTRSTW
jgi:predicted Zn-dependent protease